MYFIVHFQWSQNARERFSVYDCMQCKSPLPFAFLLDNSRAFALIRSFRKSQISASYLSNAIRGLYLLMDDQVPEEDED
jgi:hypothetical protein